MYMNFYSFLYQVYSLGEVQVYYLISSCNHMLKLYNPTFDIVMIYEAVKSYIATQTNIASISASLQGGLVSYTCPAHHIT